MQSIMRIIILVPILLVGLVLAEDSLDIDPKCAAQESCVDAKLGSIIDKLDEETRIPLYGGLELVKTSQGGTGRSESDSVMEKVMQFAAKHNFEFKIRDDEENELEEEGRTGRLKKLMIPLILALKLKMALVLPVVLTGIALIAIKGVFAGLFAIFLSGLTALKSVSEHKQDRVTAIVAAPVPEYHHHPWSRAGSQEQAQAQAQQAQQVLLQQAQQAQALDPYAGQYGYQFTGGPAQ